MKEEEKEGVDVELAICDTFEEAYEWLVQK
jgi:hypothetical protein